MTRIVALVALLLVASCSPSARIESNKAPDFNEPLKKIFVGTVVYKYLPDDDAKAFGARLKDGLFKCGVSAWLYHLHDVSDEAKAKMFSEVGTYQPQAYMTIAVTSYKNGPGPNREVNLEVSLQEMKSRRMVWKSLLSVSKNGILAGSGEGGTAISEAILQRMQKDGLFATRCVT